MSEAADIRTIALVCPECGEKLRSAGGDVVYSCRSCRTVCEIRGKRLHAMPCTWPGVPGGEAPEGLLRLPFWCFKTDVRYGGADVDGVEHLTAMVRPDRVYVPAFRQRSVLVFGDMGLLMTYNPPDIVQGEPDAFTGATLGSGQAARLVPHMVLWRADQIHDVTGVSVDVRIEGGKIVALPARDEGEQIVDLLSGKTWPEAAFLDVGSLRFVPGG